jgi:hypothetical protein
MLFSFTLNKSKCENNVIFFSQVTPIRCEKNVKHVIFTG